MASAKSTKKTLTGKVIPVTKKKTPSHHASGIQLPQHEKSCQSEVLLGLKRIKSLESQKKKLERDQINRELSISATYISQKNKLLGLIRKEFNREFREKDYLFKSDTDRILKTIDQSVQFENEWFRMKSQFERLYPGYFDRLRKKFPQLTPNDHKLCALLRMNLNTKEMAQILKITAPSAEISRIRLRKKLEIRKNENLTNYICRI